jgi:predicted nucleotidyltransferase
MSPEQPVDGKMVRQMDAAMDARKTLQQLTSTSESHLGTDLLGMYLFGSLAAGGFYPGKSDLDLMAIIAAPVEEGEQLDALRTLHDAFLSERPAWVERVELSYVALDVLRTFGDRPNGRIAVICPGEPLHIGTQATSRPLTGTASARRAKQS